MSANHKCPLSPLATHGVRPPKIPRPFDPAQRVALAGHPQLVTAPQSVQGEDSAPVFTFGGSRVIRQFTFTAKVATVPVESVPGSSVSPLVGDDSPHPSIGADAYPLNNAIPNKEPKAVSGTFATPELSHSTALIFYSPNRLHQSPKEPIGENAPMDDPMELAMDLEPASSAMPQELVTSGEISDEERSVLSYADEYPTDRSIESPSPSTSGTNQSMPNGRRSPYVPISSGEHSLYQVRKRGLEGTLVGFLGAIDALQHLPRSEGSIPNPPAGQGIQVSDQHSHAPPYQGTQNEPTGSGTLENNPSNRSEVNRGSSGTPDVRIPHNPHGQPAPGNVVFGPFINADDDATLPINSSVREGTAPTTINPSIPPLRRVRFRGVFIVGNGAPIKIDEGIEVHLRDGVDGQVDFVM